MRIGSLKISTACILLFGKNPQRFFPRARTRFIRYEGKQEKVGREMNVIKDVTFEGAILQQVRSTIDYLETQVSEHTFLGEHGVFVTRLNGFVQMKSAVSRLLQKNGDVNLHQGCMYGQTIALLPRLTFFTACLMNVIFLHLNSFSNSVPNRMEKMRNNQSFR